jgi:hypothetical protein
VDQEKRKRGGQPKDPAARKRNNLTFRTRDDLRERLEHAAARTGRSVSEEIEFRLLRDFGWEATKGDIDEMRAQLAAMVSAAQVQAIRAAGIQILREIDGKPTRVVLDLESLLAEADGVARGLRSGFVAEPPVAEPVRPMSAEEQQRALNRALDDIEEIKRTVASMAAAKNDDDEAA